MPSPIVNATSQAAVLSAVSNVMAQVITATQDGKHFSLDTRSLAFFTVWAVITTPPNYLWQMFLEDKFPGYETDKTGTKNLNKSNTITKLALDQSISASLNTGAFIAALAVFNGRDVSATLQQDFWSFMKSGWSFWPLIALLSFTVVPVHQRTLFGSIVGLFWGIYINLLAAR